MSGPPRRHPVDMRGLAQLAQEALRQHRIRGPAVPMPTSVLEAPYYTFLRLLAARVPGRWLVDLGTREGYSAYALDVGRRAAQQVVSIGWNQHGHDPDFQRREVIYHVGDSRQVPLFITGEVGLVFCDTTHDGETTRQEIAAWQPVLVPGGVIVIDDVELTEGMRACWKDLPGTKGKLPDLHTSGFGVWQP